MPIPQTGFVIEIDRLRVEQRGHNYGRRYRTVSDYRCYFDGQELADVKLSGAGAEPRGPGDNSSTGVAGRRRIKAGTYQLGTHSGSRYQTHNFENVSKKPAIYVHDTGARTAILLHPGSSFKSSVGCINLTGSLVGPHDNISPSISRDRIIVFIDAMKELLGNRFPTANARRITDGWLVINGEP